MTMADLSAVAVGARPPVEFDKSASGTMVSGRPHSYFYTAGYPGAGVAPSAGIGGEALTTLSGQLPFTNPVSPAINTYLSRLQAQCTIGGTLLLCDRLWQNSGITITSNTEQTFTAAVDIPARDSNGLATGTGVLAGVEVSTVTGAGTPTMSLKYTNQSGTTGQVGTSIVTGVAASIAGSFYPIGLANGDTGIRKPESLTLSATWTSGTIHVVLYRVLARLELQAQTGNAIDALTGGLPQLYNNTVPFLIFRPNTTTTSTLSGHCIYSQGA